MPANEASSNGEQHSNQQGEHHRRNDAPPQPENRRFGFVQERLGGAMEMWRNIRNRAHRNNVDISEEGRAINALLRGPDGLAATLAEARRRAAEVSSEPLPVQAMEARVAEFAGATDIRASQEEGAHPADSHQEASVENERASGATLYEDPAYRTFAEARLRAQFQSIAELQNRYSQTGEHFEPEQVTEDGLRNYRFMIVPDFARTNPEIFTEHARNDIHYSEDRVTGRRYADPSEDPGLIMLNIAIYQRGLDELPFDEYQGDRRDRAMNVIRQEEIQNYIATLSPAKRLAYVMENEEFNRAYNNGIVDTESPLYGGEPVPLSERVQTQIAISRAPQAELSARQDAAGLATVSERLSNALESVHREAHEAEQVLSGSTGEGVVIHPDIEASVRQVLDELGGKVGYGNVWAIDSAVRRIQTAFELAQRSTGGAIELTEEGRQHIPDQFRQIISPMLNEGLASILSRIGAEIAQGRVSTIPNLPEQVQRLFAIAAEYDVPLSYAPLSERSEGDQHPARTISTLEEAMTYANEQIDRNLFAGMRPHIERVGSRVANGQIARVEDEQEWINKWVEQMRERGFTVVDHPVTMPQGEDDATGVFVREVNLAEIRQLVDDQVRNNLARGARAIIEHVERNVRSGNRGPLEDYNHETIDLYARAAENYGLLINPHGVIPEGREGRADSFIDPQVLHRQLDEVVRANIREGIDHIVERHEVWVRNGEPGMMEYMTNNLRGYIELAKQFGLSIDADSLFAATETHITPENLQAGVEVRLAAIRKAILEADSGTISRRVEEAQELRRYVHKLGLSGKIDFSSLDQYMEATGVAPQISERSGQ